MKKTKVCCICKVDKELINYHKNKCSKDGLQTRCKSCSNLDKEYRKNYYQQNKESLALKQKERELENKESIRLNKKKKYQENRESILEEKKNYYLRNRDKILEQKRLYRKLNRAGRNALEAKRYNSKKRRTPGWLTKDQLDNIKSYYWLAQDLFKISGQTYHVDHIVPLQGNNVCGLHVPWNLQVLPSDINILKSNSYETS